MTAVTPSEPSVKPSAAEPVVRSPLPWHRGYLWTDLPKRWIRPAAGEARGRGRWPLIRHGHSHSCDPWQPKRGAVVHRETRCMTSLRAFALGCALATCVALVTSCGQSTTSQLPSLGAGASPSGGSGTFSVSSLIVQFDACMESHGVTVSSNLNPVDKTQTSKLPPAALAACAGIQDQLLRIEHPVSLQQELASDLKFAECMRKHGIPTDDPKVGAQGLISIHYGPGVKVADPNFQHALQICSAQ